MPSTSPVVNASPELPAPVSAETCQRTASRLPVWSPVHCMLGFSADAIAVAVRRAMTDATSWANYEWEIVHEPAVSPRLHLALDEVLATRVGEGRRKPTLRFWEWDESAVVIGSFQSVKNEVDPEGAEKYGFDVVRRISGGGAMMMERGNVVTYSLYVPSELVQGMGRPTTAATSPS